MAYNRYMNAMSNGGAIASQDSSTPLSDNDLRRAVPSLFAVDAHESRSDRFVPIATSNVLTALRAADFEPVYAQQARTRVEGKQEFTRHMLRMRHRSLTNAQGRAFEIILTNANDGTSSYKMIAGIFRFVCLNGLFTGDTFGRVNVRHSGAQVVDKVRDGALQILEQAPRVLETVEQFKGIKLSDGAARLMAESAHQLRFPKAYTFEEGQHPILDQTKAPVTPSDLLRPRRSADASNSLWHVYNVLQENTVKGGQRGRVVNDAGQHRRQTVRAVNGIPQAAALNTALWSLTERMAELNK